jgi:hypothetical protein
MQFSVAHPPANGKISMPRVGVPDAQISAKPLASPEFGNKIALK